MTVLDVMTLLIILAVVASSVFFIVVLAGMPGKIARARSHPQADAVGIAGWLSILTLFTLWPAALIWAYCRPLHVAIAEGTPTPPAGGARS